jgi:dihydropyrimidinase
MRRFITASDVEIISLTGQEALYVDENDVVTSVAREMAEKLGVTIVERPAKSEGIVPAETTSASASLESPETGSSQVSVFRKPWVPSELVAQAAPTEGKPSASNESETIVLKNGTIVWPGEGTFKGDICIDKGKIGSIHAAIQSSSHVEIDISGKHVMPGIIDPHVHLGIFTPFVVDVRDETKAGVWGGVTTIGCYLYEKGTYLPKLDGLFEAVERHSSADVFFRPTISSRQHLEEIPQYVNEYGIRAFKIYMSGVPGLIPDVDDGFMTQVYEKLMETDQTCTLCIHAENPSLIRWATERIMATDGSQTSVQEWSETHPHIAEEEAIRRASFFAKGFPRVSTYFVHVSTKAGIEAISQIKCEADNILAETTSPYLLFSIEKVEGNVPKWLPPLRSRESTEALWEKLRQGKIDCIGTDSVPMSPEIKGLDRSIWDAMPNAPLMEHHLPGILTEGVGRRKIPMALIVDLMTRRPAQIFGLYPEKGSLVPGTEADLVVVDMDRWERVSKEKTRSAASFSLFEGRVLTGWPDIVIKGGRIVIKDGEWFADHNPCRVLHQRRP